MTQSTSEVLATAPIHSNGKAPKKIKRKYVRKIPIEKVNTNEPILLQSKDLLGSYFDLEQINDMVNFWEEKLRLAGVELTEKSPHFKIAEEMYLKEKSEYDAIKLQVDKSEAMLQSLARYRLKVKPTKEIRAMRTTSHTKKNPKEKRKGFNWMELTINALTRLDHFVFPHRLWEVIAQENQENLIGYSWQDLKKLEGNRIQNWKASSKIKNPDLIYYQDKIGLIQWVDENKRPVGKYIKDFMYDKS